MPIAALRPYHWFDIGGIKLKETPLVKEESKEADEITLELEESQIVETPKPSPKPLTLKEIYPKPPKPKIDYEAIRLKQAKEREALRAIKEKLRLEAKAAAERHAKKLEEEAREHEEVLSLVIFLDD